jgi:signal transduction histidine kinase
MLHEFIEANRTVLRRSAFAKSRAKSTSPKTDMALELTTGKLLDQLAEHLRVDAGLGGESPSAVMRRDAAKAGLVFSNCGSASDLVFDYGAVCESVTGLAEEQQVSIAAGEFRTMNMFIDEAVASALDRYACERTAATSREELEHLGAFSHELRNASNAALFAFESIKRGPMSVESRTGQVLERSLRRIVDLVSRSLAEVRLGSNAAPHRQTIAVADIVNELSLLASADSAARDIPVEFTLDGEIEVQADRHLLVSALSNVVQNAIKYTRPGTRVTVRASLISESLRIQVEDGCGGLPCGSVEDLFSPFVQKHDNQNGLGLGLSITKRIIDAHHGRIDVRNRPGDGCTFVIALPNARSVARGQRSLASHCTDDLHFGRGAFVLSLAFRVQDPPQRHVRAAGAAHRRRSDVRLQYGAVTRP